MAEGLSGFYDEQALREIAETLAGKRRKIVIDQSVLEAELADLLELEGFIKPGYQSGNTLTFQALNSNKHLALLDSCKAIERYSSKLSNELSNSQTRASLAPLLRLEVSKRSASNTSWTADASLNKQLKDFQTDLEVLGNAANRLADVLAIQRKAFRGSTDHHVNSLMLGLASVYTKTRGLSETEYELPSAPNSIFIRFCHLVLQPLLTYEDVDCEALTNRWRRLKKHMQPT